MIIHTPRVDNFWKELQKTVRQTIKSTFARLDERTSKE